MHDVRPTGERRTNLPSGVLLVVGLCFLMATACTPKLRHGRLCDSHSRCAFGLQCLGHRCHLPMDGANQGLTLGFVDLRRRASFPLAVEALPAHLVSIIAELERPLEIEPFISDPLPKQAQLEGGLEIEPAEVYKALIARLQLLQKALPDLRIRETKTLNPQQAEGMTQRIGLHTVRATNGVPIALGAIAYSGDEQLPIPFFQSVDRIDHALAKAAKDLRDKGGEGFSVAFACIADAFCPRDEAPPVRTRSGPWPADLAAALSRVRAPLDQVRRKIRAAMARFGLQTEGIVPGDEFISRPTVVVLANPLRELKPMELEWLHQLRADGIGLVVLAPGVRVRATQRIAVAMDAVSDQLLMFFEVASKHSLISDRAALVPFRYASKDGTSGSAPLSAEIARVHPTHPVTAGLHQVNLPLPGALAPPGPESKITPLAWTRSAARPLSLPVSLSEVAGAAAAGPPGGSGPSLLAVAGTDTARWVLIRSDLGLPAMSAAVLLRGVALESEKSTAEIVARLKAYEKAARIYAQSAELNLVLVRSSLKLLFHATQWAGEDHVTLRLAPERDRPIARVEEPEPEPTPAATSDAPAASDTGGPGEAPAEPH